MRELDAVRRQYREFVSGNPGRDVQRVGTARFLGQDPAKIHEPVWGVLGNLGDSQCYLGVTQKVEAIHAALSQRVVRDDLSIRLQNHNRTDKVSGKFTRKNGPWELVWSEEYPSRSSAMTREGQIKAKKSARWIRENLLNGRVPTCRD